MASDFLMKKTGAYDIPALGFMANQIPFLIPGFQQFGEKECGKELHCVSKRTQGVCFDALHTIRCEDEHATKFLRMSFAAKKYFFAERKIIASECCSVYDGAPQKN